MTTDRVTPLLRGACWPTATVTVLGALVGGVVVGLSGAAAALVAGAVVIAFSGVGLLVLRSLRGADPALTMLVGLGSYALRVVAFGAALAVIGNVDGIDSVIDPPTFVAVTVVCIAAWITGEVRAFTRARIPIYDLDDRAVPVADPAGTGEGRGS